ncbi:MAG: toll/interleukin-1 receptor domain-containing protein [Proteobacteria bacterium]|nr:toll/interleukin-1 receptor domain-containing protein [Pseudomonadota bacterium]
MPNVFLSHRGADSQLAEKLGEAIRSAGHSVWLDVWEIDIGKQIVHEMNQGLEDAAYVVVCYSSEGTAPWMNIEWESAIARQLNGKPVNVLPARLSGTIAPAILEGTKYADLINDWDRGVTDLLKAIK